MFNLMVEQSPTSLDRVFGALSDPTRRAMLRRLSGGTRTIGELAERLQLRHHSVVGLVDRLAKEKLVARKPGKDRREVLVQLTDHGEQILADLSHTHRAELKKLGPKLKLLLQELDYTHDH